MLWCADSVSKRVVGGGEPAGRRHIKMSSLEKALGVHPHWAPPLAQAAQWPSQLYRPPPSTATRPHRPGAARTKKSTACRAVPQEQGDARSPPGPVVMNQASCKPMGRGGGAFHLNPYTHRRKEASDPRRRAMRSEQVCAAAVSLFWQKATLPRAGAAVTGLRRPAGRSLRSAVDASRN